MKGGGRGLATLRGGKRKLFAFRRDFCRAGIGASVI